VPLRRWRALLRGAAGGDLAVRVSPRGADGTWRAFAPLGLHVSSDPIDPYLADRRIHPLYNFWYDVGIYQRDLAGWDETVVVHGRDFANGCTNCHAFTQGSPTTMSIGTRSQRHGSATLLCRHGQVTKLAIKWGYTSWHPSGQAAAYSLNKVYQFLHSVGQEVRDVCDLDSDLAVYFPGEDRAATAPAIADPDYLETHPAWSADGTVPEFVTGRIEASARSLGTAARSPRGLPTEMPPMSMTAPPGQGRPQSQTDAWREAQQPPPH